MIRSLFAGLCLILIGAAVFSRPVAAQDDRSETLDVFLDCERSCDFDFIRREIPYVNYIRDRVGSDVHLLVTRRSTASGGREYELQFIGLEDLSTMVDTLHYFSGSTDTDNERRAGLTETMARGLVRFLVTTKMGDRLLVSVPIIEQSSIPLASQVLDDPWNSWVFSVRMKGEYEAEDTQKSTKIETRVSADRITEEWKFTLSGRFDYRESEFELSDGTINSINRSGSVFSQLIKSLGPRWSAGLLSYFNTSSSRNTDLSMSLSPAVEFSFFPYSESSTRDLRLRYELNFRKNRYEELTVYNELNQTLIQNQLELRSNFRQPWGNARLRLSVETYITDFEESLFDLYNIKLGGEMDIRIARGLSISIGAEMSSVHDQIWLPAEVADDDEVLLGNKRLPTDFEYKLDFGFSYRFGSIYNNVVNPRFGFRF